MNEPALDPREARLLEQRAERLRHRTETGEEDEGVWAAEFGLGNERLALPLVRLLSCVPLKGVTPVPQARRGVVGIARWEGRVVAVFSLATLLGLRGWRRDPSMLLLLSNGASVFGLDCEEIPRSMLLPYQALASAPPAKGAVRPLNLPLPGEDTARLVQWIDPDRLLERPEQA